MKIVDLYRCDAALDKLYRYGHLPTKALYYLGTIKREAGGAIEAYCHAKNNLLRRLGISDDGVNYEVPKENADTYVRELEELDNQEVNIDFPPGKITLCVESIDKIDSELPPSQRLGLTPTDWEAIQEVMKVVETEE